MTKQNTILIVDDSQTLRTVLGKVLINDGYNIIEADSGITGIAAAEANPHIDLVITDLNMPGMDGITMVEGFRAKDALKHLPVMILSNESSVELKGKA